MTIDIRNLSDSELLSCTTRLVSDENATTVNILHHLNEIERRRLHLDLGYSSLFDYCVRALDYSPSAAGRRIQGARCIRKHPQVLRLLEERLLSLSAISLIEPILNEQNCADILQRIRGASHREIEKLVSQYRPPIAFRDRAKPVRVVERQGEVAEKVLVQFLASEEDMALFEEVRSLLNRTGEAMPYADVMKIVLTEYRDRHSPAARQQRREARKGVASPDSRRRECNTVTRHIPDETRDDVYVRDGGRCAFVSRDGTRKSKNGLQVDHIRPYATGGSHELENLRLLCAAHNRRAAERNLGVGRTQ